MQKALEISAYLFQVSRNLNASSNHDRVNAKPEPTCDPHNSSFPKSADTHKLV